MGLHKVHKRGIDNSFKCSNLPGVDANLSELAWSQRQENIRKYNIRNYTHTWNH